jgi:hypothetical protein
MAKATVSRVCFEYESPFSYTPKRIGCYVGAGSTPQEAARDCLEQLVRDGFVVNETEILEDCPHHDKPDEGTFGPYWYCAVRLQLDGE